MNRGRGSAAGTDSGFTLIELVVVVVLIGLVATVVAATFVTILRATPPTQFRIDDARSTRGLQTWLARDVASTPPNGGTTIAPGGGFVFSGAEPTPSESCGITSGTNILHMTWMEDDGSPETFHANYRLMPSGSSYKVVRSICSTPSAPTPTTITLTSGVSNAMCSSRPLSSGIPPVPLPPASLPPGPGGDVGSVEICLVGQEGDTGLNAGGGNTQEIFLTVSSRNLVEAFPP